MPGWPAIADSFAWVTASVHYQSGKGFEVYVEGKNLTNAIARTYLNGNPLLPWAPASRSGRARAAWAQATAPTARTYVVGAVVPAI